MDSPGSFDSPCFLVSHYPEFPLYNLELDGPSTTNHSFIIQNDEDDVFYKLLSASHNGDLESVQKIHANLVMYPKLVNRLDPSQKASAIHYAAMKGHLNIVEFLLSNGAEVDIWNEEQSLTPLMCASAHGHIDVVKYLLEHGADVNAGLDKPNVASPLLWAVRNGHLELVKYLVKFTNASQASQVVYSETPIHAAIICGYPDILKVLIQAKGRIDLSMGEMRHTPIHYAASGEFPNSLECCRILLESGSESSCVNKSDTIGRMPLHLAGFSPSPDPEIVTTLISHGAEVDACDKSGRSTLFYFVKDAATSIECIEILILKGKCDINLQDENGFTALHLAAFKEAAGAVEVLLLNGADFSIKSHEGKGVSALNLLLRRIPSTSKLIRSVFNSSVTLTGYNGSSNDKRSAKKNCKVKIDFKFVVSSSSANERKRPKYLDCPTLGNSTDTPDGSYTGTRRKFAKRGQRSATAMQQPITSDANMVETPSLYNSCHSRIETAKIKCLIDENQGHLLLHPVIHAFLSLKWQKAKALFISIFAFKFLLVLLFSGYVHVPYYVLEKYKRVVERNITCESECDGDNVTRPSVDTLADSIPAWYIFQYCVIVFLATINGLTEVAQLIRYPKRDIVSLEPLIFLAVLFIMIFYTDPATTWTKTDKYLHRTLAAAGIWLAWVDVWMYMGRFPVFGNSIRIFFKVLWNFFVFILPHSCLFIGFILAFTLIFAENAEFSDAALTMSKLVRIMAGDNEMPLDALKTDEKHSYISNLLIIYIYTAYISTVGIVLMNLLIGLAVHDIQKIFKEATMHRLIKQTVLLNTLEARFCGKWITKCIPEAFVRKYTTLFKLFPSTSHCKILSFRPYDARDKKLSLDLKKALVKVALAGATCLNGGNCLEETCKESCRKYSTEMEENNEPPKRFEELMERLEKVVRRMESGQTAITERDQRALRATYHVGNSNA